MHEKPAVPEQHAMEMTLDNALAYALRLQQEGRIKGAVQLYTRILEQAPNHVDALHFLGLAQFQLGDGEAAVDWIRRAIALKPDFAGAYNNLGNVLKCLHHFADAAQAYHRVIELEPVTPMPTTTWDLLRAQGKAAEAETMLRRALALQPQHAGALHNLGNVLVELQQDNEAADVYMQAVRLRPYDAENYLRFAKVLYGLRREQERCRCTRNG